MMSIQNKNNISPIYLPDYKNSVQYRYFSHQRRKTESDSVPLPQKRFNQANAVRKKSLILPQIKEHIASLRKISISNCPTSENTNKDSLRSIPPLQQETSHKKSRKKSNLHIHVLNIKYQCKGQERRNTMAGILNQNSFFSKIGQFMTKLLLSIGRIIIMEKSDILYHEGASIKNIYIVITGRLIIRNQSQAFKKYIIAGQSVSQQILFNVTSEYSNRVGNSIDLFHSQTCRCLENSVLLRIPHQKYYEMAVSLAKNGYKSQFTCLDSSLKRNFILKTNSKLVKRQKNFDKQFLFQKMVAKQA